MGEVYLCFDKLMKRRVALKVPKDHAHERFFEELRLHAPLLHPNIMPILDQGWIKLDGRWLPYFTMPEYRNGPFTQRVQVVHQASAKPMVWSSGYHWTLRRLVEAVQRVADALTYAHHNHVLHLDIAPKNILTGYTDAEVLLGDWGLGVKVPRAEVPARLPEGATPRGTPGFIAPEHLQDPRAWPHAGYDIYALGAVLYTVLCGKEPFIECGSKQDRMRAAMEREPLPMEEGTRLPIPQTLAKLTRRAMCRDPHDRAVSADKVSKALKSWLDLDPDGVLKPPSDPSSP